MTDPTGFSPLVPGFEFMQNLVKSAGAALPGIGQWVAPTLDPEEIAKRIQELRTVQFWLEQNARMLGATIQAMEVQRMTLSTLKTMNVQMGDLQESMKIKMPDMSASAFGSNPAKPGSSGAGAAPASASSAAGNGAGASAGTEAPAAAGVVDPMQWWGALTRQFTELANTAMKDGSGEAARAFGAVGGAAASQSPSMSGAAAAPASADAAPGSRPGKAAPGKKPANER